MIVCIGLLSTSIVSVSADQNANIHTNTNISAVNDNAPAIGPFVSDSEYEAQVREKEALAMEYYTAKLHRNYDAAEQILDKLKGNSVTTPQNRSISPYAANATLNILQQPQEKNYWCGYAAMKSLLDYEGISKTQTQIAQQVYSPNIACPWYTINGSDKSQFPVAVKLTEWTGYNYVPYPYGAAGGTNLSSSEVRARIITTIDVRHGVMICGNSRGDLDSDHISKLPGYPNDNIGHWVASDGYTDNGRYIWIIDPAKSPAVSWSGSINPYYTVDSEKLTAFAKSKGIIW